jgi:hypothetical protein
MLYLYLLRIQTWRKVERNHMDAPLWPTLGSTRYELRLVNKHKLSNLEILKGNRWTPWWPWIRWRFLNQNSRKGKEWNLNYFKIWEFLFIKIIKKQVAYWARVF